MKIRSKLSFQFILITVGIFGMSMYFVYDQFKNYLESELYNSLENRARLTAQMILIHEDELKLTPEKKNQESIQIKDIGNTSIYDQQLNRVYSLISSAPLTPLTVLKTIQDEKEFKFALNPYKVYGYVYTSRKNNKYIVVAEEKPDYSKLEELKNILLISILFTSLMVAFGGWFFAGQSLRPLNRIINEVTKILPNDLSNRLATNYNQDELSVLIITFNLLLDRIENAFKTEKSFISNVSHELKNPIASIQTQIQFAINRDRSTVEYREILNSLQEDINGMSDTIEKLLNLARVHSTLTSVTHIPIRLDELIYQAKDILIKNNNTYKVNIDMINLPSDAKGMIVIGNESLLLLAVLNLMENACKFSVDHLATISLDFSNLQFIQLKVHNYGKAIPKDEWDKIYKPFHRSQSNSNIKGSGIGLSLVKSIAELHHLKIEVSSDESEGTVFAIKFTANCSPNKSISEFSIKSPFLENKANYIILILLFLLTFTSCKPVNDNMHKDVMSKNIIQSWYKQYLVLNEYTDGFNPPVSARTFAYIGLGGWQAGVLNYDQAISLSSNFNGLVLPDNEPEKYDLDASLNALYFTFANLFYPHAYLKIKEVVKKFYETNFVALSNQQDTAMINASDRYGKSLALAIYQYASEDSIGHLGRLYNTDQTYKIDDSPGTWRPTGADFMPALLPYWGDTRSFVRSTINISEKPPLAYEESPNSDLFSQAWEIYTISKSISPDKKWIAEFWSDDFQGVTYCAASRWVSIGLQVAENNYELDALTELDFFAKLGFALNDAGVKAWKIKYKYRTERPENYIQRVIHVDWHPLHDSPSFPAYPSGHSIFAASAAGILTHFFGDNYKMTDYSHYGRKEFKSDPRSFNSFKEMASENALSRMYLGVHYRSDCEEGLRLGYLISEEVKKLKMRKPVSEFNN